jgi:hypothetical protein
LTAWPNTVIDRISVSAAAHGRAAADGQGFVYQSAPGFHGQDSFSVSIENHTTQNANRRLAKVVVNVVVP